MASRRALQSRLSLDKKISETSVKIIQNEVGCRDDTVPKTVDTRRHARRSESMQQSSATQSLHPSFWGLRKIVACSHSSSQCLLVSGTVSSLHPTSFLMIFTLVHIPAIYQPCINCLNLYISTLYLSMFSAHVTN